MHWQQLNTIFKNASTTYFYSHLFFPSKIKRKVEQLYGFVRTADDFVDQIPPDKNGFSAFVNEYKKAQKVGSSQTMVIDQFIQLEQQSNFDPKWVTAFLDTMAQDMHKKKYAILDETIDYTYGSAEVIGLMMCKILNLSPQAYQAARLQGRAMQYINFLRDVQEDIDLGRQYIPTSSLKKHGLPNLKYETIKAHPKQFESLIQAEITRFYEWDNAARADYHWLPYRYRVAVKTASDMYRWTAQEIQHNPQRIYQEKIKPHKWWVLATGVKNTLVEVVYTTQIRYEHKP